jgi:penicillin-binding protein 2
MDKRINIAFIIVTVLFCVFVFRLWHLQVLRGSEYKKIDEHNRLRVLSIPASRGIIYDRNGRPLVKNVPSFDISVVKEDISGNSEILSDLSRLIGVKHEDVLSSIRKYSVKPFRPVVLKEDVPFKDVARIEARKSDFPGLHIKIVESREYMYGHSASHVIGYLGSPANGQLKSQEYEDVAEESFVGQFGIEKVYDSTLRGIAGKKIIEVNALGSIIKVVRIQRPARGKDITLTIDVDLQVEAENSLKGRAGAVVAIDPATGAILALASAPSFDPNMFARGINSRDWRKLVKDPKKPLLNRAVQSQYPPGSTFKILTAITALEEGIVASDTTYDCNGWIYFGRTFRCWKAAGHGEVSLHKAIVESCDVYFYEVGKILDIDVLARYAHGFGLGIRTGVPLEGEAAGIVPTTAWKHQVKNDTWFRGETLNTVIGQGYLSATPIQVAVMMAAVVNGGILYEPYLLIDSVPRVRSEHMRKIKPETIQTVKKALRGVVTEEHGTGKLAQSDIVSISGKTGTTQVIGGVMNGKNIPEKFRDHAWFVAYAPEENPEIAVSVFVEHGGHGSTGAAPIAKSVIEAYYKQGMSFEREDDG